MPPVIESLSLQNSNYYHKKLSSRLMTTSKNRFKLDNSDQPVLCRFQNSFLIAQQNDKPLYKR